jgi:hypothetical protein
MVHALFQPFFQGAWAGASGGGGGSGPTLITAGSSIQQSFGTNIMLFSDSVSNPGTGEYHAIFSANIAATSGANVTMDVGNNTVGLSMATVSAIGSPVNFRGGALDTSNSLLFTVPSNSRRIWKLDDPYLSNPSIQATPTLAAGTDKYFGGCRTGTTDTVIMAPHNATVAIKYDVATNTFTTFGTFSGSSQYAGACWSTSQGFVYFVPYSSGTVARINPTTNAVNTFGSIAGTAQYCGGCVTSDGTKMYCIPYDATQVLKVDLVAQTVSLIGSSLGATSGKYAGGAIDPNGYIWGIPYNSTKLLKIDTNTDTVTEFASTTISGATAPRWAGGAIAPNGKIYCAPYAAGTALIIDTSTTPTSTFCLDPQNNKF